jgi:hydrogenase 3 maturation protease
MDPYEFRGTKRNEKDDMEKELTAWLEGSERIVIAGVGSLLRSDDFVGMKIVRDLRGKVADNVSLIECGTTPESFVDEIIELRPTHVLVVDAALLDEPSGSTRLVNGLGAASPAISTHTLPLQIFCEYLRSSLGAKVALLAIQPEKTGFGEGLSAEVEGSASILVEVLAKVLLKT